MGDRTSATAIILTHWKRLCIRQLVLQAASGRTVLKEKKKACHDTRYDAGEVMQVDSGEGMRIQRSSWARAPLAHGRQLHGFIVGINVVPCSRTGMWPLAVAVGASISNTCDVRREARSQLPAAEGVQ